MVGCLGGVAQAWGDFILTFRDEDNLGSQKVGQNDTRGKAAGPGTFCRTNERLRLHNAPKNGAQLSIGGRKTKGNTALR